jgi:hypothetical protein
MQWHGKQNRAIQKGLSSELLLIELHSIAKVYGL